mmetsp:Transcript_44992/g.113349  ORF Transcript_44992/g.113349 Transcript_44992/m.113349 type:complete len:204 (+) Transcript_44992:776-1387(+)
MPLSFAWKTSPNAPFPMERPSFTMSGSIHTVDMMFILVVIFSSLLCSASNSCSLVSKFFCNVLVLSMATPAALPSMSGFFPPGPPPGAFGWRRPPAVGGASKLLPVPAAVPGGGPGALTRGEAGALARGELGGLGLADLGGGGADAGAGGLSVAGEGAAAAGAACPGTPSWLGAACPGTPSWLGAPPGACPICGDCGCPGCGM